MHVMHAKLSRNPRPSRLAVRWLAALAVALVGVTVPRVAASFDGRTEARVAEVAAAADRNVARARQVSWLVLFALAALGVGAGVGRMYGEMRRAEARSRELEHQLNSSTRITAESRLDNARLELAQQIAGAGAFEWDLTTGRIGWSGAMERICGLQPGGFDGSFEHWRRLIHPDDVSRVARALGDALAGRRELRIQFRIVRADGTHRWLSSRGRIARDAAGRPSQLIGVNLDLTDELHGVRSLRHSEEFFRLATDALGGVVFDVDPRDGRLQQSRGLSQLLGWSAEEMPTARHEWLERIHPDDLLPARERLRDAIDRGSDRVEVLCRVRHRDGSWRPLLARLMLVRDRRDDVVRLVGCAEDVTALRETDTMLEREAERRRQDASAGPARVALKAVVAGSAEQLGAGAQGRRLSLTLPPDDIEFDGDAERLGMVFCSLLRHCAQAAPEGGEVALEARVLGRWAIVTVRDDGVGYTAAERATLFDAPVAPDDAPGPADPGGCIRLGQARALVELHGGTLRAGGSPGAAGRFTVTLPLTPEAARVAPTRVGTR
jgi:PAS domain S-box-containing protein